MSRVPILVILGATGSGKSKLGIELAEKFTGEIISADSMQVYKGLDIITAKVTKEERLQAVHHLIDVVDPLVNFTVVDFRNRALPIIDALISKKKMPVIVGGTNYYIESLLWKILIEDPNEKKVSGTETSCISFSEKNSASVDNIKKPEEEKIEKEKEESDEELLIKKPRLELPESNEELHEKLAQVDPDMARRLHPNNRRKVIRSLEVFEKFGTRHSELLKLQREAGGSGLGGPLRYQEPIILWLCCDQEVHDKRLNSRVDSMVEAGLVKELLDFHERYNEDRLKNNEAPDYTKGIFQSIGFKEFHNYLILPEDERSSEKGQKMLQESIAELKLVTRRYARKQKKWIMNRMIRRTDRQVPSVYSLNCTHIDKWKSDVLEPAIEIVSSLLKGEKPKQHMPLNEQVKNRKVADSSNEESHFCQICERIFIGELQWKVHLRSIKHKKVEKRKRLAANKEATTKKEKLEKAPGSV
ncbi:tRNA dimethylallyltransferase [Belonocnema kinseyi]|uniref:tRNA dimethylallyltransferase n=1 Tax=Belonocnema kinseyi TaxID=2817044 RepID=UPI00143D0FF1|nr:tRNA dimethylallyltransferase [Belonocnema kinseyi]